MKAHIGVDADSGLVHTVTTTAANAHNITQGANLLQGKESDVFADSGYRGVDKREEVEEQHPGVVWHVAIMPTKRRALSKRGIDAIKERIKKIKASVRAKVGHPF
jgi:IS5 family transposase